MRQLLILANVVILFLVIPAVSNAQDTLWAKTYGDENVNRANSIAPTVDGGFIIAGWQDTLGMGAENYFYVKTTADGDPVWSDWNGGDETDIAFSVEHTADYGYIFAGTSESFGRGICDFFIIKTNYWGTLQWSATYNSGQPSDGLCARSVQQTFDGGYIIAGRHSTGDPASHEQYLLKIGDYGVVGWENGYGHSSTEPITANHVSLTIDTCYIVAGTAPLNLLKVSADGDSLWSADLGMDEAMTVYPTADGGYIVVGNVST
ncbi:MAG: hypothetical protein GY855_05100, partial [candidate division Zixibacteria bacterium]|nr:hypothetical protein [candidate division Zixibacteria bacterium]